MSEPARISPPHPFRWLPSRARVPALIGLFVVAVGVNRVFSTLVNLTTPEAPHGMISLQFAGTVDRARTILESWHAHGLDVRSGFNLGIDYLFIPAYAGLMALLFGWACDAFARSREPSRVLRVACLTMATTAWMALAGGMFDATENVFLFRIMNGHLTAGDVSAATTLAWIKFVLLGLAAVGFLVALVAGLFGTRSTRPRH
jgi:hypothetical protein